MNRISVVGLGKLGACTAACFAYRGYEVLGVDVNKNTVNLINEGKTPIVEPRLQELITASDGRLKATQDFDAAIKDTQVTFLLTPTPSEPEGHFSIKYLQAALEALASALRKSQKPYHLFVITSTVSPGTTQESLIPLIEEVSGRKLNTHFGVCYNPEFIALGSVINDFLKPDLLLIGESDRRAGDALEELYNPIVDTRPYIARMSIVSAEITKISLNTYITMKISFANTLANICERIPGAEIDSVTRSLGADRRISPYYLKGALAFGGPCFPRDNRAFIAFAKRYDCDAKLAEATDSVNEYQSRHLAEMVLGRLRLGGGKRISILGLAYKTNTPVIEESPAVKLISLLLKEKVEVAVYDPLAMDQARSLFGESIAYSNSVKDCTSRSDFWIIATPWDEFKSLDDDFISNNLTTIIDCWRLIDPEQFRKQVNYVALGKRGEWS